MIFRFCLYGFLKNQQYYAPFIVLAFREKGLSFFLIGLLITVREVVANLLEIPSGAVADLYGRRRAMVVSLLAYIFCFSLLGFASSMPLMALAMVLFGVGEAFRTGTHKAIIMDWLTHEGRIAEKTEVYGLTRSWSRLGSALSAVIAALLVFKRGDFASIFYWTVIPYILGLLNIVTYPAYLDGDRATVRREKEEGFVSTVWSHLKETVLLIRQGGVLQRLLGETMAWDGVYKSVKDYLQPLLKEAALTIPIMFGLAHHERTSLLIGVVYCVTHLIESFASRGAHRFAERFRDEERAADGLWRLRTVAYIALLFLLWYEKLFVAMFVFIILGALHNLWRPIQVGRIQSHAPKEKSATILSVDAQSKALSTLLIAPILGLAVDNWGLFSVGLCGILACLFRALISRKEVN